MICGGSQQNRRSLRSQCVKQKGNHSLIPNGMSAISNALILRIKVHQRATNLWFDDGTCAQVRESTRQRQANPDTKSDRRRRNQGKRKVCKTKLKDSSSLSSTLCCLLWEFKSLKKVHKPTKRTEYHANANISSHIIVDILSTLCDCTYNCIPSARK